MSSKKVKLILLAIWCLTSYAFAQPADTLIYAIGNVTSAATNEPIEARISYQSLPYGSKVGLLSGSEFRFPLFDKERYSITVEAAGYAPAKYMLDPAQADADRLVRRDVQLGLPSSAASVANDTHTEGKVLVLDNLIFDQGKAKIDARSHAELDSVVMMLNQNPNMIIQLEGHTDTRGDPKQNLRLSEARVEAVKDYLISKNISKKKVKTKAFGGTQPVSKANTEEAHTLNRRVELRVLKN